MPRFVSFSPFLFDGINGSPPRLNAPVEITELNVGANTTWSMRADGVDEAEKLNIAVDMNWATEKALAKYAILFSVSDFHPFLGSTLPLTDNQTPITFEFQSANYDTLIAKTLGPDYTVDNWGEGVAVRVDAAGGMESARIDARTAYIGTISLMLQPGDTGPFDVKIYMLVTLVQGSEVYSVLQPWISYLPNGSNNDWYSNTQWAFRSVVWLTCSEVTDPAGEFMTAPDPFTGTYSVYPEGTTFGAEDASAGADRFGELLIVSAQLPYDAGATPVAALQFPDNDLDEVLLYTYPTDATTLFPGFEAFALEMKFQRYLRRADL